MDPKWLEIVFMVFTIVLWELVATLFYITQGFIGVNLFLTADECAAVEVIDNYHIVYKDREQAGVPSGFKHIHTS